MMTQSIPAPGCHSVRLSAMRCGCGLLFLFLLINASLLALRAGPEGAIPLPEHPRPDFQRVDWLNLNGPWAFRPDPANAGDTERWFQGATPFPQTILVPFPWGSALSQVKDEAPIGWYARSLRIPEGWRGQRVFLVVGACDWFTQAWLDGQPLGRYRGGYTPFELELTPHLQWGHDQRLVLRVDDTPHPFKLEGKQGYGNARGIWQTVYLEARPQVHLDSIQFAPDIDNEKVNVKVVLSSPAPEAASLALRFKSGRPTPPEFHQPLAAGAREARFTVPLPQPRLWSLEDPFLYELDAVLALPGNLEDRVATYFGMRQIGVERLPGLNHPYIALNHKPIYLQMTLDQAYHPEGFYTFPSDAFMRDEILRSRRIGLNAMRIHVKIDAPRKLYWADRLGLLIMADVPNSWGEPEADMRQESETALRGMIRRDFNHPSIFSWVLFNETWGLVTKGKGYTPETQQWVATLYQLAKQLDGTRLVEDNSPCNLDHVVTDINSWHTYLPGYGWKEHLDQVVRDTFAGSAWNYIGGRTQGRQPLLNSECGNVWGYEGSTGDVDWSWDYHIMMNEFRRRPKICGWLYTEHHDVINEWNGYYRFDRSEKFTGLSELAPGMTLADLHGAFYVAPGAELCTQVKPGTTVEVPLWASFMTDQTFGEPLRLRLALSGWDTLGRRETYWESTRLVPGKPWMSEALAPVQIRLPNQPCVAVLSLVLESPAGTVLHRNFTTFLASAKPAPRDENLQSGSPPLRVVRFAPQSFRLAQWSLKQWNVLDGLKVNGAGHGFFEYHVSWPTGLEVESVTGADFRAELSAKQLFGKDRAGLGKQEGDFMLGKGTHDPSLNPNSYPMTDTQRFPSAVRVRVAGHSLGVFNLPDDPADHQGILSWHAQLRDRKLREAGSYGYLVQANIPAAVLKQAAAAGELVIRLEVDESLPGGLAIYGERFGRYPLDPTLVFALKE